MATYNKRGYKAPKPEEAKVENELEEVIDTTDSTTAEVFNTLDETASKTEDWVAKNQKMILGIVGAIAIATIGYVLYNKYVVEEKEAKANNEIFQAQQYFQQAVDATAKPDSLYNLALKGGEGKLGFVGIADQYAGTDAGNLANYYAGMSYLNLGDFKNAITYLENFKSDDAILKPLALGAIGDAFSETNNNLTNMGVCVDTQDMQNFEPALSKIVTPGNIYRSMLYHRLNTIDETYRMPLHGRTIIHEEGIQLVEEWINSLSPCN